jgi:hypothetical protein
MGEIVRLDGAWREVEITLAASKDVPDPYTGVEVWADFTHDSGLTLRRPAFYDGGRIWRIRFSSPQAEGRWQWQADASFDDTAVRGASGIVEIGQTGPTTHRFERHGFWKMSPGGRSLVHADGTPALLVADTAWALPWRATEEHVRVYAADRQSTGFNAVLLMSVQPDMRAAGPRDREADEGFDVAFEDLPAGHLDELNPAYFQYLDRLLDILVEHEIVPVLQPVFQGFGWKGLDAAGTVIPPAEYARYCRYLVARYGARPAIYLVGADGSGQESQIAAGGAEVHAWDCYAQPTGIHYRPLADNRASQNADWLDFQWCQTGHGGEHVPERSPTCGATLPPRPWPTASRATSRHAPTATPPAGGRATKPGPTCVPEAPWAWSTEPPTSGNGNCTMPNPAMQHSSWPPPAVGATRWRSKGPPTSVSSERSSTACPPPTWNPTGRPSSPPAACACRATYT